MCELEVLKHVWTQEQELTALLSSLEDELRVSISRKDRAT